MTALRYICVNLVASNSQQKKFFCCVFVLTEQSLLLFIEVADFV